MCRSKSSGGRRCSGASRSTSPNMSASSQASTAVLDRQPGEIFEDEGTGMSLYVNESGTFTDDETGCDYARNADGDLEMVARAGAPVEWLARHGVNYRP